MKYTQEELDNNTLSLEHRELGLFDQVVNDVTVDHPIRKPATRAGRASIIRNRTPMRKKTTRKMSRMMSKRRSGVGEACTGFMSASNKACVGCHLG